MKRYNIGRQDRTGQDYYRTQENIAHGEYDNTYQEYE